MKRNWLVVSHSVCELGTWIFDTRKEALEHRRYLIQTGCEIEDIELYYGKLQLSKSK